MPTSDLSDLDLLNLHSSSPLSSSKVFSCFHRRELPSFLISATSPLILTEVNSYRGVCLQCGTPAQNPPVHNDAFLYPQTHHSQSFSIQGPPLLISFFSFSSIPPHATWVSAESALQSRTCIVSCKRLTFGRASSASQPWSFPPFIFSFPPFGTPSTCIHHKNI